MHIVMVYCIYTEGSCKWSYKKQLERHMYRTCRVMRGAGGDETRAYKREAEEHDVVRLNAIGTTERDE